ISGWFAMNGWTYPIPGAPARGVAAVQQFFEHMGLSKPPALTLVESNQHFDCESVQPVSGKLNIRTTDRKWVYAEATSDKPWLRVPTPSISGPQQAMVAFEIDPKAVPAGAPQSATLRVMGNAGQSLTARVTATSRGKRRSARKPSRDASSPL